MFKNVDKSMLLKLVALHVIVITVSNALVAIPVEILGVRKQKRTEEIHLGYNTIDQLLDI